MSKVRVVLNKAGIFDLLRSEEMAAMVTEKAEAVAAAATGMTGLEYATSTYRGPYRVNASVFADSVHAYRENLKNDTLMKAVGSIGGG